MSAMNQNKQTTDRRGGFSTTGARRIKYGTNVLIMCIAALVILAMVNFVSFRKYWRKDMAAAGTFQPSERTKRILDQVKDKVVLTTVYTSTQDETSRENYLPTVEDYCQELEQLAPGRVDIEHVASDAQKAALLARIQGKYSAPAQAYTDRIEQFVGFAGTTETGKVPATQPALPQLQQAVAELSAALDGKESYLGSFPQIAGVEAKLTKEIETLTNTPAELKRLTRSGGIPRYGDARDKISQTLDALQQTLSEGQKAIQDIAAVSQAGSEEFFQTAAPRMAEMGQLLESLQATVGKSEDRDLPPDSKAALQAYAREAQRVALFLNEEAGKQEALAKKFPAIAEMPNWLVRQDMGVVQQVIPLPTLLRSMAEQQMNVRLQIRELLSPQQAIAADELAGAIRKLRQLVDQQVQIGRAVGLQIVKLSVMLGKTDEASAVVLEKGKGGEWLADVIQRIDAMKMQIAKLPELKLSEVSDKLDAVNTIVVQIGEKIQVLSFDEVWPQRDPLRGMPGTSNDAPRRVFNGDTAIGGVILALSQPPVATIVFVHYAGEVPPQMRQFMPPPVGSIPYETLETLRNLLGKANLEVREWNLAKGLEAPQPQKDTQSVYVFLPPPSDIPMPGPQNQEQFGQPHLDAVKKLLASGAKAIFLCKWEGPQQRSPFMPPIEPKYGYAEMLREVFGVDTVTSYRTVYGVLESREGSKYGVNVQRWLWMPMNNFTDLPVGKSLRGRRVLMTDVCPVDKTAGAPGGLRVEPILTVPNDEEYWATKDVMELIRSVVSEKQGGLVTQGPADRKSPFPVAQAIMNDKGEPMAVVLGTGGSVMDSYMNERIPRLGDRNQSMRYDPAPTANADVVVNAALWLSGRADLVGAGPVIMPPVQPVPAGQMTAIYALVWAILPGLVILGGVVMFLVRRR